MIRDLGYRPYRPAGYTDDLGILADRNQWVSTQKPGWYVLVAVHGYMDVIDWLIKDGVVFDRAAGDPNVLIFYEREPVVELMLRWG